VSGMATFSLPGAKHKSEVTCQYEVFSSTVPGGLKGISAAVHLYTVSSAEVKKAYSYVFTVPIRLHGVLLN